MIIIKDQSYNKKKLLQISPERKQDYTRLGEQGDPLGIEQENEVWPYEQMVYAQLRFSSENEMYKLL